MPKQVNEDLLIDAAAEVFAERGYDGARVAEIARRAGMTTGAIYSRYSGKSELLLEALKRSFAKEVGEIVLAAMSQENNNDNGGILTPLHLVDPNRPMAHGALFLEAVVAGNRDEEIATILSQRVMTGASLLAKKIDQQKADGKVNSTFDTDALKTYILAMQMGFLVLRSLNYEMPAIEEWEKLVNQTRSSILKSIGEKK